MACQQIILMHEIIVRELLLLLLFCFDAFFPCNLELRTIALLFRVAKSNSDIKEVVALIFVREPIFSLVSVDSDIKNVQT